MASNIIIFSLELELDLPFVQGSVMCSQSLLSAGHDFKVVIVKGSSVNE